MTTQHHISLSNLNTTDRNSARRIYRRLRLNGYTVEMARHYISKCV